jgi:predicted lipoprotein with Yx(FWY)xxD motif
MLIVIAATATGCGDDEENGGNEGAAASPTGTAATGGAEQQDGAAPARKGATLKLVSSQFGRILADGRGQAVYFFDKEGTSKSRCYGACAEAWPPVLTRGAPRSGSGARGRLLGTTRRRDGKRQVTYRGRPLYYYVDDSPGRVLCHNVEEFGGLWLVVRANGMPVS